jgi:hypothetical protein
MKLLLSIFSAAEEKCQTQHQKRVRQNRSHQRRLHDLYETRLQRKKTDE